MVCLLTYRIVTPTTAMTIYESEVDAADADEVDFINWNKCDGIDSSKLKKKHGTGFRPLSSEVRAAIDFTAGRKIGCRDAEVRRRADC